METVYSSELSLTELHAVTKSIGISMSVVASKMDQCSQGSPRQRTLANEWRTLSSAQDALAETLSVAMEEA